MAVDKIALTRAAFAEFMGKSPGTTPQFVLKPCFAELGLPVSCAA